MSYIFPKRALRAGDVLDPIELTLDFGPAAERLSGRLNAHNLNQTIASTVAVTPSAYYTTTSTVLHVPFGTTNVPADSPRVYADRPDATFPANAMKVPNTGEWTVVPCASGAYTPMTLTTGESVLWINAFVQYVWYGFTSLATPADPGFFQHLSAMFGYSESPIAAILNDYRKMPIYHPCRLQFALRVNGNIIDYTVTGIDQPEYRASVPVKPVEQRDSATSPYLPGPRDYDGPQISALGPATYPVRVSAVVPVSPGTHTVELMVRRLAEYNDDREIQYGSTNLLYLYSRQLHCVEIKAFPDSADSAVEVLVPAIDEEDTLDTADLYTNRYLRAQTASNAIVPGNLARGALMHYHLPGALNGAATYEAAYSLGMLCNSVFPGSASNTVTTSRYVTPTPSFGWSLIGISTGFSPLVTVAGAGKTLILANVMIRNVYNSGSPINTGALEPELPSSVGKFSSFAALRLMWQPTTNPATTWTSVFESTALVNNTVWYPFSANTGAAVDLFGLEQHNIALIGVVENPSNYVGNINIGAFASVFNLNDNVEITYATIMAIRLRN